MSAGPWGSAEGPSPRERRAAFPSLSSAHTGGPRPFPSHAWSPWAAGGAQRSHLRRPTGLRSPISPRGAGRGALRGAVGAPATGNPSWGPHLEHVSVTLLWGPIWGPHLQHPVHIWVILLWGTHFGVLISSTRCTFGSSSYGEPNVGPSPPAPGAHLGHPPMGNPFWGSSPPAPGAHLGRPPTGIPFWGPHFQHPVHIWVILLWGTQCGALITGTHCTHWSSSYGEPILGVFTSSTRCILVTLQWGSHFGGPHVQHPVHVWVALLWGTHLGGPHLPHPVHFGHPPMEFPFWGSSPCASGACCPERRRRAPGGAVGVRQWGGRGWAPSCCVRSRAKGRGWGPTWRPVKGLGLERGPAEGFRPAGGPGSTSSAWGLPGSWGGRGKGRENPDGAELGASGALTTA